MYSGNIVCFVVRDGLLEIIYILLYILFCIISFSKLVSLIRRIIVYKKLIKIEGLVFLLILYDMF